MLVAEAARLFGYEQTAEAEVCFYWLNEERKRQRRTIAPYAETDTATYTEDLWVCGRFVPGSIQNNQGSKGINLIDIPCMGFDFDLRDFDFDHTEKPFTSEALHAMEQGRLDDHLASLRYAVERTLTQCRTPVSAILVTGYGLLAISSVAVPDRTRVSEIRQLHKQLVEQINDAYGSPFADQSASDAGTRGLRLVGSVNTKNPAHPREVRLLFANPDAALRLDDWELSPLPHRSRVEDRLSLSLGPDATRHITVALSSVWKEGRRHPLAVALAGMCLKAQVDEDSAYDLMLEVAADDEELDSRLNDVRTTYRAEEEGRDVAGYTMMRDTAGPEIADAISAALAPTRNANVVEFPSLIKDAAASANTADAAALPDCCFPDWFQQYVSLMRPATGAHRDHHLATALTYAGAFFGRRVMTFQAGALYPNLYTVLVGTSGSGKTTVAKMARTFFGRKSTRDERTTTFLTPLNIFEGNMTPEFLYNELAESPNTIFIHDELDDTLRKSHSDGYMQGFLGNLNILYDCPDGRRVGRVKNEIVLEQPTLSMVCCVTPQALGASIELEDVTKGFVNRLLLVYADPGKLPANTQPISEREAQRLFEALYAARTYYHGRMFEKTDQANTYWDEVKDAYNQRDYATDEMEILGARLDPQVHKVALIYAAVEGSLFLERRHLEMAFAYVDPCLRRAQQHSLEWSTSGEGKRTKLVKDTIRRFNRPVPRREVMAILGNRLGIETARRLLSGLESEKIVLEHDELLMINPEVAA